VGRVIFPPAKVPDFFAYHIGLAWVIPFLAEVIFDADGEQNIPAFAV
jgi:hypothetical protein